MREFKKDRSAFETETFHRLLVEAVRFWVIEFFLRRKKLPDREVRYVYADGPMGIGWGNSPGPDDPSMRPLRKKRIKITVEIEDF